MICQKCGSTQPDQNKFCGECGLPVGSSSNGNSNGPSIKRPSSIGSLTAQREDRRHVTVVFADLVNSSHLVRQLDPEQWQRVQSVYKDISLHIIRDYEGHLVEFQGDGLVARFDSHELSAESAIHAATDLVREIAQLRPVGDKNTPTQLELRIGIASGEAVVVEPDNQTSSPGALLHGMPPYIASRLQSTASPNEIIISKETHQLVKHSFTFDEVDNIALKGFDHINQAWKLVSTKHAVLRFDLTDRTSITPLVGRDETMAALHRRWQRAKEGNGQVVFLNGEAGIGKSRIVSELQRSMNRFREPSIVLRYQVSPYSSNVPLFPVIQQFASAAQIEANESEATIHSKIKALLESWNVNVKRYQPMLMPLMLDQNQTNANPEVNESDVKQAIKACTILPFLFTRRCPVLVIIEDMHWADPASRELLRRSIIRAKKFPMMIIVTGRPEYKPADSKEDYVTEMKVKRLSKQAAKQLLNRVQISQAFSPSTLDSIISKSEGIPLFLEEMALNLSSHSKANHAQLPATLVDSLIDRFGRLSKEAQQVARAASVIGHTFDTDTLYDLLDFSSEAIDHSLRRIVQLEICFPSQETLGQFTFNHALMQNAIYDTILNKQKHALHLSLSEQIQQLPERSSVLLAQRLGYHQKMINRFESYAH